MVHITCVSLVDIKMVLHNWFRASIFLFRQRYLLIDICGGIIKFKHVYVYICIYISRTYSVDFPNVLSSVAISHLSELA